MGITLPIIYMHSLSDPLWGRVPDFLQLTGYNATGHDKNKSLIPDPLTGLVLLERTLCLKFPLHFISR